MSDDATPDYEIVVNGNEARAWHVNSGFADYDAIHATAGAILAGAETVQVREVDE